MKRFLSLLISLIALSSCGVLKNYPLEQEYNEVWKGKTYNEIVMSFGAPDRVESDGNGGNILVYEEFNTTTTTDVDTHFGNFDPDYTTKVRTSKKYTHFFISSDNSCYHVKSNMTRLDAQGKNGKAWLVGSLGVMGVLAILFPLAFI